MPKIEPIDAPFPWFGGKSRVAPLVWERFGDVQNYVEPFAGSLAVLLARPTPPQLETVNDLDCYLANFWRATQSAPEEVVRWCDQPVNEADLHARHKWLLAQTDFRERMKTDPDYYDAKIAGWWVWGLCSWIGSGWCVNEAKQLPHLGNNGRGVHRKLPHLGSNGMGVHKLGAASNLLPWFEALRDRLRRVRVVCGEWSRVLGESVTVKHGTTAVFLDPPYSEGDQQYSSGGTGTNIEDKVREWAIANGDNPLLRIALCGYEGNHAMPSSWECVAWKTNGGYGGGLGGQADKNKRRERVWFSPYCLSANQIKLFQ